jgi:hypothetical protein
MLCLVSGSPGAGLILLQCEYICKTSARDGVRTIPIPPWEGGSLLYLLYSRTTSNIILGSPWITALGWRQTKCRPWYPGGRQFHVSYRGWRRHQQTRIPNLDFSRVASSGLSNGVSECSLIFNHSRKTVKKTQHEAGYLYAFLTELILFVSTLSFLSTSDR